MADNSDSELQLEPMLQKPYIIPNVDIHEYNASDHESTHNDNIIYEKKNIKLFGLERKRLLTIIMSLIMYVMISAFYIYVLCTSSIRYDITSSHIKWITTLPPISNTSLLGYSLTIVFIIYGTVIKFVTSELQSLSVFSLAYEYPINIYDLNVLASGGLFSLLALYKYSFSQCLYMGILILAGISATLGTQTLKEVPLSFLHNTTTTVGVPALAGFSNDISYNYTINQNPLSAWPYGIQMIASASIWEDSANSVPTFITGDSQYTNNYIVNARYYNIIGYTWTHGCIHNSSIPYTLKAITQLDKSTNSNITTWNISFSLPGVASIHPTSQLPNTFDFSDVHLSSTNNMILDDSKSIYIVGGKKNTIQGFSSNLILNFGIIDQGVAIYRVQCNPQVNWNIYNCRWNGNNMDSCTISVNANTTILNTKVLNSLGFQLKSTTYLIQQWLNSQYSRNDFIRNIISAAWFSNIIGKQTDDIWNNGTAIDASIDTMFGSVMLGITKTLGSSLFGTQEIDVTAFNSINHIIVQIIPTIYILVLSVAISIVLVIKLFRYQSKSVPARNSYLLDVAHSTRSKWWNDYLYKLPKDKSEEHDIKMMYGGIPGTNGYVGLGTTVFPLQKDQTY